MAASQEHTFNGESMQKIILIALVMIGLYLVLFYYKGTTAFFGGATNFATNETKALQGRG